MPSATSIFADPTGNGQPAAPPSPAQAATPQLVPSYADFYRQLGDAAAAQYRAHPSDLWSWVTGSGSDAARQAAQVAAPDAYFKMLAAQQGVQGGQLDLAQTVEFLKRAGLDPSAYLAAVSGNAPQAAAGSPQGGPPPTTAAAPAAPAAAPSAPGVLNSPTVAPPGIPAGQASPTPTPAANLPMPATTAAQPSTALPVSAGAPGAMPAPSGAVAASPPLNPADAMRARYASMAASMAGLPKYAPQALEYMKLAQTGAPPQTIVLPNGQVADAITGQPINMDVNAYLAARQGGVAGADARAQVGPHNAETAYRAQQEQETNRQRITGEAQNRFQTIDVNGQKVPISDYNLAHGLPATGVSTGMSDAAAKTFDANLQRGTDQARIDAEAKNRFSNIVVNGQNVPISDYDLARLQSNPATNAPGTNGVTRGFADQATHDAQVKQITDSQKEAGDATKIQGEIEQTQKALAQFGTSGPLSGKWLSLLQHLSQVGLLDDSTQAKVAAGELANMNANSIVGAMVRAVGNSRIPVGIFNKVDAAKPGLLRAQPQLALEALRQDFIRTQDFGRFTASYYSDNANATKLDAQSAFDKAYPIEMYESRIMPPQVKTAADYGQIGPGFTYKDPGGNIRMKPRRQ